MPRLGLSSTTLKGLCVDVSRSCSACQRFHLPPTGRRCIESAARMAEAPGDPFPHSNLPDISEDTIRNTVNQVETEASVSTQRRFNHFEKQAEVDHAKVQQLFQQFNEENVNDSRRKTPKKVVIEMWVVLLCLMFLVSTICTMLLTFHIPCVHQM